MNLAKFRQYDEGISMNSFNSRNTSSASQFIFPGKMPDRFFFDFI